MLVYILVLVFALAIVVRIVHLQYIEGDKWKSRQVGENSRKIEVPANRGDILSSDGRVLASSIPSYSIHMDFRAQGLSHSMFYNKVDSLAICLSKYFRDKSYSDYRRKLVGGYQSGSRYFRVVDRRINYNQLQDIKKFPLFRLGANRGGFIATQYNTRKLPFGILASRTIGRLNYEQSRGIFGIEHAYNNILVGVPGVGIMKTISGRRMNVNLVEPLDGKDVISTIDIELQDVAESALYAQLKAHAAHHGCAVLMEVETGEIKAISNLERMESGEYSETYNYAIGEGIEPGSTFKLASMIVALEDGVVKLSDSIETGEGVYEYYNIPMRDSHEEGYGKITVKEVFEKSSNIGVSKIIFEHYHDEPNRFVDRLLEMGLDKPVGIDLEGEAPPSIANPASKSWSGTSLPWMSIGYEVILAPIQTLAFYNAIANDGKMVKPRLVKAISYRGDVLDEFKPEVINSSICSRQTLKKVHELLEGVVENGTASNLKNSHYKIAGKTGTAQIAQGKSGYCVNKEYYASFCGHFLTDNPKYTYIVAVNSPSRNVFYGNVVAGNVFREIADKVYVQNLDIQQQEMVEDIDPEFKVPVTLDGNRNELINLFSELDVNITDHAMGSEWVHTYNKGDHIDIQPLSVYQGVVPNVRGMGAKDALFLLENAGLKVKMTGVGRVVEQSLAPGSKIFSYSTIYIKLR